MEPPILISLPTENPAGDIVIYFSWTRTLLHPFRGCHSFTDRTQSIHCLTSFGYGPRIPTLPQRRDHQYFPSLWKTLTLEQKHHLIDKLRAAFNAFNSWFTNRFITMDNEGIPRSEQFYWLFPQKIEWNAPSDSNTTEYPFFPIIR